MLPQSGRAKASKTPDMLAFTSYRPPDLRRAQEQSEHTSPALNRTGYPRLVIALCWLQVDA